MFGAGLCHVASCVRSNPAENVPPLPCKTQTFWVASDSKSRNAACSFFAVGMSMAFRFFGRFMAMVVMPSLRLVITSAPGSGSASFSWTGKVDVLVGLFMVGCLIFLSFFN